MHAAHMIKRCLWIVRPAFTLLVAFAAMGCGPTQTPEEARAECERFRADVPACFTDEVFDQCVACHEECGRECNFSDGCPNVFTCDN
jgi:hypothetical protein